MLKKFGILFFIFCIGLNSFAYNITEIKSTLFTKDCIHKLETQEFKTLIQQHKKDTNYLENYYATQSGYKYYKNNDLKGYFIPKLDVLYMYSLQERNNPRIIYYYNIWGQLQNLDFIYGEYPGYPYFARKYKPNGQLINTIYYPENNTQIIFDKTGNKYKIEKIEND